MRLFIILFLLTLLSSMLYAQEGIVINENFENVSLAKVLKKLNNTYNIKIAYDNTLVQKIIINQKLEEVPLKDALDKILSGTNLSHQFLNGKVIIIPLPEQNVEHGAIRTSITISGIVKDGASGETLPNATLQISGTNKGAITNTDGYFTIFNVPSDTNSLVINYLGYQVKKIQLSSVSDLSNVKVGLQSELKLLDEITISDESESPLEVNETVSRAAFNPRALSTLPSLAGQDLFRTLQLMPGVSSTNESSAGLVIRGSVPSQNLILLDGFTIYHLDHFFGVFSGINADFIKDVQIYKSGFDAKYGGRVSGVVDITGRTGSTNKANFNFGANLINVHGTTDIPVSKRISFLFSFRRAYSDIIQSNLYRKLFAIARDTDEQIKRPVDVPRLNEIEPRFYFYDVNSKITFRPSRKDNISLSIYGGKDDLSGKRDTSLTITSPIQFSFEENLSENTNWGNGGLSLRWGRQWNEKFYSNLKLSGSNFFRNYGFSYRYRYEFPDSVVAGSYEFSQKNEVNDSNFALDNEWQINEKLNLEFGFSGMEYNIRNITVFNRETADSTDNTGNIGSLYATIKINLSKKLTTAFGIRRNYHQHNDRWYDEPRLSIAYAANKKLNLKAAIGRYYQFVNQIQYDDPYNGIQNFWVFSIKGGAPVVQSNHYVIGGTYKTAGFLFDIEAYYKDLEGVVEFNPVPYFLGDGNLNTELFLLGRGRMRGIDFLIAKETGKHKGWLSYSYSRSLHAFQAIGKGKFYPSLQDQPHEIKLVNMLALGKWNLSATWVYGTGRPFPEYEIFYITDPDGVVQDLAVMKDRTNFRRLPDYHRMDISGAYHFTIGKFSGEAGLSIFNVYGRRNVKTRRLSVPDLQRTIGNTEMPPPIYRDLVLIDFTPSVFFNIGF